MQRLLTDINLTLSAHELMETIQSKESSVNLMKAEAAFASSEATRLAAPAAILKMYRKTGTRGGRLHLRCRETCEDHTLDVGKNVHILDDASLVIVSVYTVGKAIEGLSASLSRKGEMLKAYLVDAAGVALLEKTGRAVNEIAEIQAAERKWGVSPSLSPGSLQGWHVSGQKEMAALLDLFLIQVKLNETGVLEPYKSVSTLIGIGPGYHDSEVGHLCRLCSFYHNCSYRVCSIYKNRSQQ